MAGKRIGTTSSSFESVAGEPAEVSNACEFETIMSTSAFAASVVRRSLSSVRVGTAEITAWPPCGKGDVGSAGLYRSAFFQGKPVGSPREKVGAAPSAWMSTRCRWITTSAPGAHHTAASGVFMMTSCAEPPPSQPKGSPTSKPENGAQPCGYTICPGVRTVTWESETPADDLNFTATGSCESGWSPSPKPGVGTATFVEGTMGSFCGWTAIACPSCVVSKKLCHGKSKILTWMFPAASCVASDTAALVPTGSAPLYRQ